MAVAGARSVRCVARSRHVAGSRPAAAAHRAPRGAAAVAHAAAAPEGALPEAPSPVPEVVIDNLADPFATMVSVKFGDLLGELLDTVQALKGLGLTISRADVKDGNKNRFYVTDARTGEKVIDVERIEEIRLTILQNMLEYHPESQESLAMGFKRVVEATVKPLGIRNRSSVVRTKVTVVPAANGTRSAVRIETLDRPGLLIDIVETLKDLSLKVLSAEVDTVGLKAVDIFYVTYHDAALTKPMVELVVNSLQYFLQLHEVDSDESC